MTYNTWIILPKLTSNKGFSWGCPCRYQKLITRSPYYYRPISTIYTTDKTLAVHWTCLKQTKNKTKVYTGHLMVIPMFSQPSLLFKPSTWLFFECLRTRNHYTSFIFMERQITLWEKIRHCHFQGIWLEKALFCSVNTFLALIILDLFTGRRRWLPKQTGLSLGGDFAVLD